MFKVVFRNVGFIGGQLLAGTLLMNGGKLQVGPSGNCLCVCVVHKGGLVICSRLGPHSAIVVQ